MYRYKILKKIPAALILLVLTGCTHAYVQVQTTSSHERMIKSFAWHTCGEKTVLFAALNAAAKETIKAGFQEFGIKRSQALDKTRQKWVPERIETKKIIKIVHNREETTTSTKVIPGYFKTIGNVEHYLWIRFLTMEKNYPSHRVNAYTFLGPQWSDAIKKEDHTINCD